jgi:hypothetical protein
MISGHGRRWLPVSAPLNGGSVFDAQYAPMRSSTGTHMLGERGWSGAPGG